MKISLESARAISSFTLLSFQRGGHSCRHRGTKAWHLSAETHPTAFGKAGVSEQHGEDSRLKQACRLFGDSVRKQMFCKRKIANILFSKDDYFGTTRQVWSVWKLRCLGTTGTAAVCSDIPSSTSPSRTVPQPGPRILALEVKSEVHPIFGGFHQVLATHCSLWRLDHAQSPLVQLAGTPLPPSLVLVPLPRYANSRRGAFELAHSVHNKRGSQNKDLTWSQVATYWPREDWHTFMLLLWQALQF